MDILKAEQSQTKEIVAKLDHLEKEVHDIRLTTATTFSPDYSVGVANRFIKSKYPRVLTASPAAILFCDMCRRCGRPRPIPVRGALLFGVDFIFPNRPDRPGL